MWSQMYIGLHVKYRLFLSDFNETLIFLTDFRKPLKYKIFMKILKYQIFMKIRPMPAELFHADGRTNMTKLAVAFLKLENAPNKLL